MFGAIEKINTQYIGIQRFILTMLFPLFEVKDISHLFACYASPHLGFKGLFLGFHDGKSFLGLDFSLHGEKGKKGD
jgi:hypothetical protein